MRFQEVSPEVLQSQGPIVQVTGEDIRALKERAERSPRLRARICAHPGPDDQTHEMLIVLLHGNLIRPHFHPGKVESFHMMAGRLTVVQFEEDGSIMDVVRMGDYASGRAFYYRQTRPIHHTILCETESVAFHETTQGPFSRTGTTHPDWAPDENDGTALKDYLDDLRRRVGVEA